MSHFPGSFLMLSVALRQRDEITQSPHVTAHMAAKYGHCSPSLEVAVSRSERNPRNKGPDDVLARSEIPCRTRGSNLSAQNT